MSGVRGWLRRRASQDVVALTRMARDPRWVLRQMRDGPSLARVAVGPARSLMWRAFRTSFFVPCPHREAEILVFMDRVMRLPAELPGCIVEAGCFKGGSTAKISLAAERTGRRLVVFDSFEGLPPSDEAEVRTLHGTTRDFSEGMYAGSLDEVRTNVARHGAPQVCEYVRGWFEETMPSFDEPIAAMFLDVDLSTSTRTCLEFLWPLLQPGGYVFSHDGHLPAVLAVLQDDRWWHDRLGVAAPRWDGAGRRKVLWARRDAALH